RHPRSDHRRKPAPADLPERWPGARGGRAYRRASAGGAGRSLGHAVRASAGALHDGRRRRARRPHPRCRPLDPGGQERRPVAASSGEARAPPRPPPPPPAAPRGPPAVRGGRGMARSRGVFTGDSVMVISPEGAVTAVGMVPKMRRYTVTGTIEIGMHEYDSSTAYPTLPGAKGFAG